MVKKSLKTKKIRILYIILLYFFDINKKEFLSLFIDIYLYILSRFYFKNLYK